MKTRYFDINGTIVREYQCKSTLANGAFEQAVRDAGFGRLVCMSNVQKFGSLLAEMGHAADSLAISFDMCWGAFRDVGWFRRVTTLVPDPDHRARYIDVASDWWYLDDLAENFLEKDGKSSLFAENIGTRILAPQPNSDGTEILDWIRSRCRISSF